MATKNTAPAAAQPELFDDVHTKFEAYAGKEPYLFVSYSHRDSKVVYSILDDIPGIGDTRRKALLRKFKSVENIRDASEEELAQTESMNTGSARQVYEFFHKS